jgi:hypothetical protein
MDDDTRASNDENEIYIEKILESDERFVTKKKNINKKNLQPFIKFNVVYEILG